MSGLGDLTLHIEVKDRFRRTGSEFRDATPRSLPSSSRTIAQQALTNEVDTSAVTVGGPVALEVLQELGPVRI
ncbi:hypothetical protein D3C87_2005710 [compost metagenome]